MNKIPGYYTTKEIMALLDCNRGNVSDLARRHGWKYFKNGTSHLYVSADVDAYLTARTRTKLMKLAGFQLSGSHFERGTDYDAYCPVCEPDGHVSSLAVEYSQPLDEKDANGFHQYAYTIACERGHITNFIGDAAASEIIE